MSKRFCYSKFVRDIAATCLNSDMMGGFEALYSCPNPQAAQRAMIRLIIQLRQSGDNPPRATKPMPSHRDKISDLVYKAIVPRHLRPETPEEVDKMLDSMVAKPLSEETVQRMVRKIKQGLKHA